MKNELETLGEKMKTDHSKNAVFYFFIFGIVLFLYRGYPLVSLKTALFFVIGMFLTSILSIPSYLIRASISKKISLKQAITLKNIYWILELAYDFLITYILFRLFLLIVA